jgi:hypothetical protein
MHVRQNVTGTWRPSIGLTLGIDLLNPGLSSNIEVVAYSITNNHPAISSLLHHNNLAIQPRDKEHHKPQWQPQRMSTSSSWTANGSL